MDNCISMIHEIIMMKFICCLVIRNVINSCHGVMNVHTKMHPIIYTMKRLKHDKETYIIIYTGNMCFRLLHGYSQKRLVMHITIIRIHYHFIPIQIVLILFKHIAYYIYRCISTISIYNLIMVL